MQILTHQPSLLLLKKKVAGLKGQFPRVQLAVYPFEVEFLRNIQYQTFFIFQKNYQIIGEINGLIPRCEKGSKYQLRNAMNLIYFKVFSSTNVVYKWSVYRKYANGEEEFLESCTLNLKQLVHNFIKPQRSIGQPSNKSLIQLSFNTKQMRLKFPKTGLILMFMLFISNDAHQIKQYVEGKLLKKYEDHCVSNLPTLPVLKADSSSGFMGLSSRRNQNSAYSLVDLQKKKSKKKESNQSLQSDSKSKLNIKNIENKNNISSLNGHIDNIIMRFDGNVGGNGQLKQESRDNKLLQFQKEVKQENISVVRLEQKENTKKQEVRDFGMLKLQSDQGRIHQQQIDKRLQLEQLQAIEQEHTSKADAFQSQHLTPLRPKNKKKLQEAKQTINQIKQESSIIQNQFNVRKVVLVTLVSIIFFLIAVSLSKNIKKKVRKSIRK